MQPCVHRRSKIGSRNVNSVGRVGRDGLNSAKEKVRKAERPTMVPEAIHLKVMYECAASMSSHKEADFQAAVVKDCLICCSSAPADLPDTSCPFCLQAFHQKCLVLARTRLDDDLAAFESFKNQVVCAAPLGVSLHRWFVEALCPFCKGSLTVNCL